MNFAAVIFVGYTIWLFQFEVIEHIIIETDACTIFTHKLEDGRIAELKKCYDIRPNLKYKDKINPDIESALHQYGIEPVPWSKRDEYVVELAE